MHLKEKDNFLLGVQHALTLPIRARCAELTVLFDRATPLELHGFFPGFVDHVFGPQGTLSWGLRMIAAEPPSEDFRQLQHFFSPCGPVFKIIYTLLKDCNVKYDFPLVYLPAKIRQFLDESQVHPFYSELAHIDPQTKRVLSILLNPFDYYMFHFAYHLINPWQQRGTSGEWNTAYFTLCIDYFLHFLPTDPADRVLPIIYYSGKNPLQTVKSNLLDMQHKEISSLIAIKAVVPLDDSFKNNLGMQHPRNEIWRSETVLTVFTDMWLQCDRGRDDFNDSFQSSFKCHYELPTPEFMRVMRGLLKQIHAFAASIKADDTPMVELKKIAIPMIQGKFYIFIRNLIRQWPLDGSFRLVLELWLTYIQPWRYFPKNLLKKVNKKNYGSEEPEDAQQPTVSPEYLPFIADNFLTYVVIFRQLLPRFGRVDLVSPKMAVMLYRLTKVFDQPNLPNLLKEIESSIQNDKSSSQYSNSAVFSSTFETIQATSPVQLQAKKKWSVIVRERIFELEGPGFEYEALFRKPLLPEVLDLLCQIKRSIVQSADLVRQKEQEEHQLYSGFWGSFKYFFSSPTSNDEFTLNDRRKVPMYLQTSLQNLTDMFDIGPEGLIPEKPQESTQTTPQFKTQRDLKFLMPESVRSRLGKLKYEGDPDLHPIKSTENAFLVRNLYQLAKKINETYGPVIYRLYHDPGYTGRLSRQFICPPITVYSYDKSQPGSPRVGTNLPPRISLRFMAAYKFLTYLFLGAIMAWIFGYKFETYLIMLIVLSVSWKCLKALWNGGGGEGSLENTERGRRLNYPTEGFGNISFNDSF